MNAVSERKSDNFIMIFILGIYPFIPSRYAVGSVTLQSLFLFCVIAFDIILHFMQRRKYQWYLPGMHNMMGIAVCTLAVGVGFSLIQKMLQDNELGYISFDGEVFLLALIGAFVLLSSGTKFHSYYFDYIIYAGLLLSGIYLYFYLCGIESGSLMELLLQGDEDIASYMVLLGTTSVLQYCGCRGRYKPFFYATVALISFFLLFLTQSVLRIGIMILMLIAVPILFRSTVELVKRDMQMLFLYLFLLSNMCLIAEYSNFVSEEFLYSLQNSVYLEMAMAAGGIIFLHYWERIPEGVDTERLVLRCMRKGYRILLGGLFFLAFAVVIGDVEGKFTNRFGVLGYLYERTKMWGVLLLVFTMSISAEQLKKKYHPDKPETVKLIILSAVFMVQLFLGDPVPQTYPIYIALMLCALYSKEERRKIYSIKIKKCGEEQLKCRYEKNHNHIK